MLYAMMTHIKKSEATEANTRRQCLAGVAYCDEQRGEATPWPAMVMVLCGGFSVLSVFNRLFISDYTHFYALTITRCLCFCCLAFGHAAIRGAREHLSDTQRSVQKAFWNTSTVRGNHSIFQSHVMIPTCRGKRCFMCMRDGIQPKAT